MPEMYMMGTRKVLIVDSDGNPVQPLGAQGNGWNAAAVAAGGTSTALDKGSTSVVSAFGNASAATTITIQVSQNNATWFDTAATQVLAGAGDFHITLTTAARYVRLKSSGAATITGTITSV